MYNAKVVKVNDVNTPTSGPQKQILLHIPQWSDINYNGKWLTRGDLGTPQEKAGMPDAVKRQSLGTDRGPLVSILTKNHAIGNMLKPGDSVLVFGVPGASYDAKSERSYLNLHDATIFPSAEVVARAMAQPAAGQQQHVVASAPANGNGVPFDIQPATAAAADDSIPFM